MRIGRNISRVLKNPLEVRTETAKRAKSIGENDLK
jgi:hypothetical protein